VDGQQAAGNHRVQWDGRSDTGARVASGVYIARLRSAEMSVEQKLILAE
jgi:flagellar hook assembly protein FlgD